jgi:hypothetical protein
MIAIVYFNKRVSKNSGTEEVKAPTDLYRKKKTKEMRFWG